MNEQWRIAHIDAREILDSRGNPTIETTVTLEGGAQGTASVPSGASTGAHEAVELRDGDPRRYGGKGVRKAVEHVRTELNQALKGWDVREQTGLDRAMLELDGTENKGRLGANAILSVSLAAARTAALAAGLPLYQYLGGVGRSRMPLPMMNILNGGAHAANNLEVQEFMVVPVGAETFAQALHLCSRIFHTLKATLAELGTPAQGVGDEGGYAPNLPSDEAAIEAILKAGEQAGYRPGEDFCIALDCAASEWAGEKGYVLTKSGQALAREALLERWQSWAGRYPICSIEDGAGEEDWAGWQTLTRQLGGQMQLVGDDLFVTNPARLAHGIQLGAANAVLIKPNQIGTLTETMETIALAQSAGYGVVLSHRSGETCDSFLADLAVAAGCGQIKAGAPSRGERVAKYNRLLAIEGACPGLPFGAVSCHWKTDRKKSEKNAP